MDGSFVDPNIDNAVYAITLQPDGKIWIGGLCTLAGGGMPHSLARLNADGTLDTGVVDANFATGAITCVRAVAPAVALAPSRA